jgi:hypothetical protein
MACRQPAMSGSEGGWCAVHEREAEGEIGNREEPGHRGQVAA